MLWFQRISLDAPPAKAPVSGLITVSCGVADTIKATLPSPCRYPADTRTFSPGHGPTHPPGGAGTVHVAVPTVAPPSVDTPLAIVSVVHAPPPKLPSRSSVTVKVGSGVPGGA